MKNVEVIPTQNCPDSDLNSVSVNPNYIGVKLLQCGFEEVFIFLENKSENCILFNWNNASLPNYYNVKFDQNSGLLKPERKKYFKILIESLGCPCVFQKIPLKCRISSYNTKSNTTDSNEPDGYFEYTEDGFYEKLPSNKQRDEYQFSLNVNLNIRVLNSRKIDSEIFYEEQVELKSDKESMKLIKGDGCFNYDHNLVERILWDVIFCEEFKRQLESAVEKRNCE